MSVLKILKKASSRKKPFGKIIFRKCIGQGSNASVWRAYFPKIRSTKIVKRINFERSRVFCEYNWDLAQLSPQKHLKVANMDLILGIFSEKTGSSLDTAYLTLKRDGAERFLYGNEFANEVAIGACLKLYVNTCLPCHSFCHLDEAWSTKDYGMIAMSHAGKCITEVIDDLHLSQIQSVVLQVLVSLSWAQEKVKFKHHDLHTGNVFVRNAEVSESWTTPKGIQVKLPSTAKQAVIADFGLSAATDPETLIRHSRIDFDLMSTDRKGWGEWNDILENNCGYDIIVFLSCMAEDTQYSESKKWLQQTLKAARSLVPKFTISKINRPLSRINFSPEDFLLHEHFNEFRN
jgi:hypothetical protein